MTPLLPVFSDDDLSSDAVLQLGHMRNDTDQPLSAFGQSLHGVHRLIKGILIQRAEALIDEHGVETNSAGMGLNLIRQADCQGQGCKKGFTAGQRFYTSYRAVIVIDDIQIKAALASASRSAGIASLQIVLTARHNFQALIGPPEDPVK